MLRQHLRVRLLVLRRQLRGDRLARLLRAHLLMAEVQRPLQRALALRVLLGLDHRLEPAFSFSQMRGTAKNQVGLTSGR